MLIALSVVDTFEPTVLMHQEVTAPTHAAQQEVAAASTTWFPFLASSVQQAKGHQLPPALQAPKQSNTTAQTPSV